MNKTLHCLLTFAFITTFLHSNTTHGQIISTFAGCGIGDDSLAVKAELFAPSSIVFDQSGNTYVADYDDSRVRMISPAGIVTTFAGCGIGSYFGDGGPATLAALGYPSGLAIDRSGNVYIADLAYDVIRKVSTTGIITTVAGTGTYGYNGDLIPATAAQLRYPTSVAVDTSGNIYIADESSSRIRKVNTAGIISTVVGTGTAGYSGMGGPAIAAEISYPFSLTLDKYGELYIGDVGTDHIFKVDTAGVIVVIAGTGVYSYSGDGGPATSATMSAPTGLAVDTAGNVYFSDFDNSRVRVINYASGIVTTAIASGFAGFSGDGGPASAAQISAPHGLGFDNSGNFYICDYDNNRVRKVSSSGVITTFAGQNELFGEGYPALNAQMSQPQNLAVDAAGNIYVADIINQRIRKISATTGEITTVAGAGIGGVDDGYNGDGGPATNAHMYYPSAMAFDRAGNLYICDQDNQRVRKVNTSGIISTIAGNGTSGFSGDGGPGNLAELHYPTGVVTDKIGNVYICDNNNFRIRKVDTFGVIHTIAGTGTIGYGGDGGPASIAQLSYPSDVAMDFVGNLYISDGGNNCIRIIDTNGVINTFAGNGTFGFGGDGGSAGYAMLGAPYGIKADSAGNVYIADHGNQRIRMVNTEGTITTVAGTGYRGFTGDGGLATLATLDDPTGVAIDKLGNLYIADANNFRIRKTSITLSVPVKNKPSIPAVQAYPNPVSSLLNISNAAGCRFSLVNLTGSQVMQGFITANKDVINVNSIIPGIYNLVVTNNTGAIANIRIVKE